MWKVWGFWLTNLLLKIYYKTMCAFAILVFYIPAMIVADGLDDSQSQSVATLVLHGTIEAVEDVSR